MPGATTTAASLADDPDRLADSLLAADTVKRLRHEAGLSQIVCAARAGVSVSHLRSIEQGAVPAKSAALNRVLQVLHAARAEANA